MSRCNKGKSCSRACISRNKKCIIVLPKSTSSSLRALVKQLKKSEQKRGNSAEDYSGWNTLAEGFHGRVAINPERTRAVKVLRKDRPDGKEGKFGEYEVELATKMGELGHSPRIHSSSPTHIEMDVAKGSPLWKTYQRGEEEPVMNSSQARRAGQAIRDLHLMGFAHRDLHSQQFIVDGNSVKLVDFGLSRPISEKPFAVLQDLAKINSLVRFDNPELKGDPYFDLVNKYLTPYREIGKSTSKASQAKREELAKGYLRELQQLEQ